MNPPPTASVPFGHLATAVASWPSAVVATVAVRVTTAGAFGFFFLPFLASAGGAANRVKAAAAARIASVRMPRA